MFSLATGVGNTIRDNRSVTGPEEKVPMNESAQSKA